MTTGKRRNLNIIPIKVSASFASTPIIPSKSLIKPKKSMLPHLKIEIIFEHTHYWFFIDLFSAEWEINIQWQQGGFYGYQFL